MRSTSQKLLVPLWAAIAAICLGCATTEWHMQLSPNAMEEWRENGSYYALREIVDTHLYLWQAPRSYVPTSDDCIALLGEPYTTEFPGRLGNLLVYRSRRKTGAAIDTVLTFGTNELITNLEWLDPSHHPWGAIELPHAEWGPIWHSSVMTVDIGLDEYGRSFRGYTLMSTNTLSVYLAAKYKRYGEFPVMIGADSKCKFRDVAKIVSVCREAGLWRQSFIVIEDKKSELTSSVGYSAPVLEDDKKRKTRCDNG
jgi:biopolymer transport protein ExbD